MCDSNSDTSMKKALNILYCHGLGSSVQNRTAQFLTKYFSGMEHHFECLKYRNPGSREKLWRVNEWREDVENRIKEDNWILIATSAGANSAINATIRRPENVKGLFLFCPGSGLDLSYVDVAVPNGRHILESGGTVVHPASRNGHDALIDLKGLKEFMETCATRLPGKIPIKCPIGIVHGTSDTLVPFENSVKLSKRFESDDVFLKLIPGGTHFLEMNGEVAQAFDNFMAKFGISSKEISSETQRSHL